jgi:hypothetical protein
MTNYYNDLSFGKCPWLKNEVGEAGGSPPGTFKVTPTWLFSLLLILSFFTGQDLLAQVNHSENFTSSAGGYTGFTQYADATVCGGSGGAVRFNLYEFNPAGALTSPSLGTSDGTQQLLTFDYKVANWSANTVGTPGNWGTFEIQYSSSAGGPWVTIGTVDQNNHVTSGTCANKQFIFTPSAGPLYLRFNATWASGDYYLSIDNISLVPNILCSGTPAPGNTVASVASVCPNSTVALSLQNSTPGIDVTYQWQSASSVGGPYTNIASATSPTYTATVTANTWYQTVVTCNAVSTASNPVNITLTPYTSCYCVPSTSSGCTDGDVIARVILNTLDNNSGTGCPSGALGYSNYTTSPGLTTTLQAGSQYNLTVYAGQWAEGYAAWIDYNDDGTFNNSTERVGFSVGQVAGSGQVGVLGSSATFPIILACNPPVGQHRLRVRAMYATNGSGVTPCTANTFGETEDYLVTITEAAACPQPTSLGANSVTSTSANLTWTIGCAETAWEVVVQPAGSGVPTGSGVTTSTNSYAVTNAPAGQNEFYVRADCQGDGYSVWSGPYVFSVPPCTDLLTPADAATNVVLTNGATQISFVASPGATTYDVMWGTTSGLLTNIGSVNATIINITGLVYNTTYYWSIAPRNANGAATGCTQFSFTTEAIPANDVCSGATSLNALTSPISGSTLGGFADDYSPSCNSTTTGDVGPDRFYSITVQPGYTLVMGLTASGYDSVHAMFVGTCASQNELFCSDTEIVNHTYVNNTVTAQTVYWVQDSWYTGTGTYTLAWTLTPPPVQITSFTPSEVCSGTLDATDVTLTGMYFAGATSVTLNGASTAFTVNSDTSITVNLTSSSTAGPFVVTTPVATGTSSTSLVINQTPVVAAITNGNATLCVGGTQDMDTTSNGGTWSSSNTAVATVDSQGIVTAVGGGTATISYSVTDNGCTGSATSSVTVNTPIQSTEPTAQTVLTGTNANFIVTASGAITSYQWQVSTDGGSSYSDLSNDATYSGVTTNSLTITNAASGPSGVDGNYYRVVITGVSPCANFESAGALLTVGNTGIVTHPAPAVTLCSTSNADAVFTVVASGDVDNYYWYEDQGFGPALTPIVDGTSNGLTYSGATTNQLTISGLGLNNSQWSYFVVVDGPDNDAVSSSSVVMVYEGVAFTTQPAATANICSTGGSTTLTVAASGAITGYTWEYYNGSAWVSVANNTPTGVTYTNSHTSSLTIATTSSTAMGTYTYRAVAGASAPCGAATSQSAQVTVSGPTVVVTPSSATYCSPGSAVSLTASGANTYAWAPASGLSTTSGATVLASPTATTTYTVTGTDANGCTATQTVTITAGSGVTATATSNLQTVCPGAPVQLDANGVLAFTTGPIGSYTFAPSNSPYTPITGGTTITLPSTDDDTSALINIGFNFNFGGTTFTNFAVSTNGFISLGATSTSTYTALSGSNNNVIAFNSRDLNNVGAVYRYIVTGTAPNRILKIQAQNFYRYNTSTETGNAQVWLYETTNAVEMRYGTYSATWSSGGVQVGLRGASNATTNVRSVSSGTWAGVTSASASNSNSATITQGTTNQVTSGTVFTFAPGNSPAYTYSWTSIPSGFTSALKNPVANPTASTTYNVVVTSAAGCSGSASVSVNVESGAAITTQPVAQTVCAGQPASFSVVASGAGLTYQWRKDGVPVTGNATATTANFTIAAATAGDAGNYDVIVTPTCGAAATSNSVALTVNPLPVVAPSSTPVCEGSTLNLAGNATGAVSYLWTGPNAFTSTEMNPSISSVTAAASGIYTFTATSGAGCTTTATLPVTINSIPTVTIVPSSATICPGASLQLDATGAASYKTGAVGSYTFATSTSPYTPITGATTITLPSTDDDTSALMNIGFPFSFGGSTFTNFAVSTNGYIRLGATATTSYAALSSNNNNVIAFNSRDLNNVGAVYSYVVTGTAPNRILKIQAQNFYRYNTATETGNAQVWLFETTNAVEMHYGTYSATWSSSGVQVGLRGASTSTTDVRSVSSTTWAGITSASASNSNSATITQGTTNQVTNGTVFTFAPGNTPTFTYAWTSTPSGFVSSLKNPVVNPTETTTYHVVATSNAGCSGSANATVTVEAGASITSQPVAQTVCSGQPASFSVVAAGPAGMTYQWRKDGVPVTGNTSATTASLTIAATTAVDAGNYDVVVTPVCGAAATSNPASLTVNPTPVVAPSASPACTGTTLTLAGNATGASTYQWTGPNGFTSTEMNPSIPSVTAAANGVYTFTATSGAGCTATGTVTVTVNNAPGAITVTPASSTVCSNGAAVQLTATGGSVMVLAENFNNNAPAWTINSGGASPAAANFQYQTSPYVYVGTTYTTTDGGKFAMANADAGGSGSTTNTRLVSPTFSTVGLTSATLTFEHHYQAWTSGDNTVKLEISTDGGATWTQLVNYMGTSVGTTTSTAPATVSLNSYLNQANLKIRYNYISVWGYRWIIDNVAINGSQMPVWSPSSGLFTDAAATTPYTGSPASAVYAKPAATTMYTATITSAAGCSTSQTATVTVSQAATYYADADGDGFGNGSISSVGCTAPAGYVSNGTDCNDSNNQINPGHLEVYYNGVDDNCDGQLDEGNQITTTLYPQYCGATLTQIYQGMAVNYMIPNVTMYRFRLQNLTNPAEPVQYLERGYSSFKLTDFAQYHYGTKYAISTMIQRNGIWLGYYGPVCEVTSPAVPRLQNCGGTVAAKGTLIFSQVKQNITGYQFEVTRMSTGQQIVVNNGAHYFSFNQIPFYATGEAFQVRVSVKTTSYYSEYGEACVINTPGVAQQPGTPAKENVKLGSVKIVAYPNPYTDSFSLKFTNGSDANVQVQVYDMIGKLLDSRNVSASDIELQQLGKEYPSGVYNIIVTQDETVKTLRVIKR